mmetsp:Transcript_14855/g.24491  ORF Transcript_14855/g.24491 Transcript_14855/m.24491 type:complete len:209 (-) Transcript_14855:112-738(-)|eukprot:CAMPEP_0184650700 /NCGR_PEP_ID=MMETSP0308-20130426/8276_1 /TAXON_ID=38269 /ORGANISM="Gloeochaete witrockiana, Strain SAG 46.84" /LENGTH=208 /DNA_ID=CAMNT_0027084447 /DNA_START=120 /DNA_END=746 /DNA_ORIENTATION=+
MVRMSKALCLFTVLVIYSSQYVLACDTFTVADLLSCLQLQGSCKMTTSVAKSVLALMQDCLKNPSSKACTLLPTASMAALQLCLSYPALQGACESVALLQYVASLSNMTGFMPDVTPTYYSGTVAPTMPWAPSISPIITANPSFLLASPSPVYPVIIEENPTSTEYVGAGTATGIPEPITSSASAHCQLFHRLLYLSLLGIIVLALTL